MDDAYLPLKEVCLQRPESEVELSPVVRNYWEEKGYCVHGEVSIHGYGQFIDHVAHTGNCEDPEHLVGIEMKRGADKHLRKQISRLESMHLVDELWAVVISNPRKPTIKKWENLFVEDRWGGWVMPGLMEWNSEGLREVVEFKRYRDDKLRAKDSKLLLVDENRDIVAGHSSNGDHDYVTHWKLGISAIKEWAAEVGEFTTEECSEIMPDTMEVYSKPRSAMNKMLRILRDRGKLRRIGRDGNYVRYEWIDEKSGDKS